MIDKPIMLYAEDEDGVRNQLSRFLKQFSSELFVAADGKEGLELYKKYKPDIVLSDIKMPNMNGIEMVKAIKQINPKQHVIFTTAHNESGYFIDAIEIHVDGYVLKPINLEKLETKLNAIKEQINIKTELVAQQKLTHEITQLQDNILFVADKNRKITFSNQKFLEVFSVNSVDDFNAKNLQISDFFVQNSDFFYPLENEDWIESIKNIQDETKKVVSILDEHGEPQSFLVSIKPIKDTALTIIMLTEVTSLTLEKRAFEHKAYTDELANIHNRAYFEIEIDKEIARSKRENTPLSMIILDIDKFKDINDNYGHLVGDEILKELAKIIKQNRRESDTFARWGGDEFVVILPNTTLKDSKKVAEYLRVMVEKHISKDGLRITCSFGVAQFSEKGTKESLLNRADDALYIAKENGRNRVES